jgi:hypothetical protein
MQDLRRRSFRTVLAATVLSSALAVWAGAGPAAATVTPEPSGRVPQTADTPSKPVTRSKPVSRKPAARPMSRKPATKPAAKTRMTAPKVRMARVNPKSRTLRKARVLDTFRYRLGVSVRGTRGYAMATGRIEITDTGATNNGTIGDWGGGTAAVSFTPVKDDGTNVVTKDFSADNERKATKWTDDNKIARVKIKLCKILDPADPDKNVCRELDVPRA